MVEALAGGQSHLALVALKALLLFLTAVVAFRIAQRRTVAEMGAFDFVAAVAAGAIVGRVPNAPTTSYVEGAVTLVTILAAHAVLTRLRFNPSFARLIDHRPRILVAGGRMDERQMRRSGLTRDDVLALMRAHDVHRIDEVRYLIFEQRGSVSVVKNRPGEEPAEGYDVVEPVLRNAAPEVFAGPSG